MKTNKIKQIGLMTTAFIMVNIGHAAGKQTPFDVLGSSLTQENRDQKSLQNVINELILESDKNLFNDIYKTLTKGFNVTKVDFHEAWADAISRTQGGETLECHDPIKLKCGEKEIDLWLKFVPQVKLSGFIGDTKGIKHYSSAIQNTNLQKAKKIGEHAVNLWKQEIKVDGQKMQFLRHGCTRGGENATKEILLNALLLQHGEEAIAQWKENDEPLKLKFANVQLMTLGPIADQQMPLEQIDAFNKLFEKQTVEFKTKEDKLIKVKPERPLLFNFGVNLQHFRSIEKKLADIDDKKKITEQNLRSFRQLFGERFPELTKSNGNLCFEKNSFVKIALDQIRDENKKQQIQILSDQIFNIYQSHPEGLKENPYAFPIRVLALTHLLGYTSSFNCKSGKDRTGVCSMELSNLCAQIMSKNIISDPKKDITEEERKNLQTIYKLGFSAKDISRINTVFQKNLNIQKYLKFDANSSRFGIDWKKSFEENIEKLEAKQQ